MENLNEECFAYPAKKKYPIFTKQATLKSFKEYTSQMDKYSQQRCNLINERFIKAASLHGIKFDDPFYEAPRQTVTYKQSNGTQVTMSKIASMQDIQKAEQALQTNRHALQADTMKKIAFDVCKQSQQLCLETPQLQHMQRIAGLGVGDRDTMKQEFLKRASLVMIPQGVKSRFAQLYNTMAACQQEQLYKHASQMCDTLNSIDKLYQLEHYYGTKLQRPQDVCHQLTMSKMAKQAQDFLHINSTDTILSKKALLESKDKVQQFLKANYNFTAQNDQQLFTKVASLPKYSVQAMIEAL